MRTFKLIKKLAKDTKFLIPLVSYSNANQESWILSWQCTPLGVQSSL